MTPPPVIFLGMSGVGKTTIAMSVAKKMNRTFIDTDESIASDYDQPLYMILDTMGTDAFIELEAKYVEQYAKPNHILAPGGSVIYGTATLERMAKGSVFIYLYDEPGHILDRITNLETRGIIGMEKKSFHDIWAERHTLYAQHANVQFNIHHHGFDKTVDHIVSFLSFLSPND